MLESEDDRYVGDTRPQMIDSEPVYVEYSSGPFMHKQNHKQALRGSTLRQNKTESYPIDLEISCNFDLVPVTLDGRKRVWRSWNHR